MCEAKSAVLVSLLTPGALSLTCSTNHPHLFVERQSELEVLVGRMVRRRRSEFWISGNDIDDEGRWEWAKTGHVEVSCKKMLLVSNENGKEVDTIDPDHAGGGLGLGGGAIQLARGELPRLERPRHLLLLLLLLLARLLLLQQPALHLPAYLISTRIPYYQPYGIGNPALHLSILSSHLIFPGFQPTRKRDTNECP